MSEVCRELYWHYKRRECVLAGLRVLVEVQA